MVTFPCPAIKEAPHAAVSPVRAAGAPWIVTLPEPEAMGLTPWPLNGHEWASPTLAAGAPTMVTLEAPERTTPPWLEASPCRTALGTDHHLRLPGFHHYVARPPGVGVGGPGRGHDEALLPHPGIYVGHGVQVADDHGVGRSGLGL
jgi:hypothetical protein